LHDSVIRRSSVVKIQIFDARKAKKRDKGSLGVIHMTGGDAIDHALGGQGMAAFKIRLVYFFKTFFGQVSSLKTSKSHLTACP
jgi:hypothetical protein